MSDAWDDYWTAGAGQPSGCLPDAMVGIDAEQARLWGGLAKSLAKGAKVVDLATGDGAVLRRLSSVRRDLTLTGFDRARTLPAAPRGVRLTGGVAMEHLPLRDRSVGAVTSQFGFEYGDIDAVAVEIARVLRPGGRVALLTHRADSPILEHNRTRREGLRWVLDEARLLEHARAALPGQVLGGPIPPVVARGPEMAVERFGLQSAGWELAEAVRRCLSIGAPDRGRAALDDLDHLARNEVGRIDSLDAACRTAGDGRRPMDALRQAGLTGAVCLNAGDEVAGRSFGWWIEARGV